MRPHRRQPTRLPRPWDSPGKNTGVGCHFLLQCLNVTSASKGNTGRGSSGHDAGCAREHWAYGQYPRGLQLRGTGRHPRKECRKQPQEPDGGPSKRPRLPSSGGGLWAPSEPVPNWKPPLSYLRRPGFAEAAPSSRGSTASRLQSNGGSEEDCPRLAA